ncbi:MAG: hypothetical protein IJ856_04170, partial [Candidatus Methanomethylophilaceae archaeon]|nr:hypothetical protein [Candidatus Methanomethylophilaceae archaeon]
CRDLPRDLSGDLAFSSLCPPMNCPQGIDSMGGIGKKCAYVSSANRENGIEGEVWKALGMDYSYSGYHTDYPYRYLKSKGFDAKVFYFEQKGTVDEPSDACADRMVRVVSMYRKVDGDAEAIIRDTVDGLATDGRIRLDNTVRMGLLLWNPDSETGARGRPFRGWFYKPPAVTILW